MASGAEVVVTGVSRSFGPLVPALRDVSLRATPGEVVLLTGPSGSGKSTLLNLIAGLDQPDAGRVLVDGADVARLRDPARFRREVVGVVFQLHHLVLEMTAAENVELPLVPAVRSRRERRARACEALADVGLGDRLDHRPGQLSGGERQLAAVARAVVGHPRLLLADEPTGALDSASGDHVLELLTGLARARGMTIVLVSHDPQAARWAQRVVTLRDGRVVGDEPGGRAAGDTTPAPRPVAGA